MELTTKSFTILAATLVVGIILVTGAVVPVIAGMSDDGGSGSAKSYTIPGDNRFSFADANTNITFYPVAEGQYSLQPDTVPNRTVYNLDLDRGGIIFCSKEHVTDFVTTFPDMSEGEPLFDGSYSSVSVVNDVYTVYFPDGSSKVIPEAYPVWYFTDPLGDFVETVSYGDAGLYYETPYAFRDTSFVLYLGILQNDVDDSDSYVVIYGSVDDNTVIADSENHTFGESATFSINNDVLTSVSLSIDGVSYTVPLLSGAYESTDGLDIDGYTFWEYSLILPVNVIEGEGKKIPSVIPSTEKKMNIEMTHFSFVYDFAITFNKGQDDDGVPCFIFQPSFDAEIPLYAYPGQILYADGHSIITVEKDTNGEPFIWLNYIGTEYDETGDIPIPVDGIYLVEGDSSVTINYRYAFRPTVDQEGINPSVSGGSTEFGYYVPIYNEGITEWGGFLERGIYTIVDGSARIGDMPVVGLVRGSSDCISFFANGTYGGDTYSFGYDLSDGVVSNLHGQISGDNDAIFDSGYSVLGYDLVIPEDDGGESGGSGGSGNSGSSVPNTLKTTLSVVPLLMIVGMVVGVISYFRIRN